ncbi:MAG: TetR/AcrR family transcriptional regulator [Bacteroidales bacterium]|nr:TetR/AcrR family transcriptional regulator [Bacteroidales bacterium]MDD3663803.1 TetR/AcrR family transcriptional regulator [Bacteroidales bacterium]
MKINDSTTESNIMEAAKRIFVLKGFEGARMQEIADEAGINKALLHYYFRSKDKLFEAVFIDAFVKFVPTILITLNSNSPLFRKIEVFVDHYIDVLSKNPFIPGFILHELGHNTERLSKIIRTVGLNPDLFVEQVKAEIEAGSINPIDPRDLLVNMLAMCIFPFVGKPILKVVLFKNNEEEYHEFLNRRKIAAAQFIINSIKKR